MFLLSKSCFAIWRGNEFVLSKLILRLQYWNNSLFLSLVPLSYIVVLIGELANKHLSITSISSKLSNMAYLLSNANIDIEDNIRGRSTFLSKTISRSVSISSVASSCAYHLRIECNNDFPDKIEVNPINSSHLSYSNNIKRGGNPVSKTTNPDLTKDL